MRQNNKILICGGGSYGVALSHGFRFFPKIIMWERRSARARKMEVGRTSSHMPDVILPATVSVTSDIRAGAKGAGIIFLAVPAGAVEKTIALLAPHIATYQKIVICSKGFASKERLLSDVIRKKLPLNPIFCLSGPNLAIELVNGEISVMVLAGEKDEALIELLSSDRVHIKFSEDLIGVQIGGALKNVVTILLGIAEGAGFGQNTRSYLFVEGLKEIENIGCNRGGIAATFSSHSCLGDLMLMSRNRQLGIRLGKGERLKKILATLDYQPEGIESLKAAHTFAKLHGLDVPIIDCLYKIVVKKQRPRDLILELLEGFRKREI